MSPRIALILFIVYVCFANKLCDVVPCVLKAEKPTPCSGTARWSKGKSLMDCSAFLLGSHRRVGAASSVWRAFGDDSVLGDFNVLRLVFDYVGSPSKGKVRQPLV